MSLPQQIEDAMNAAVDYLSQTLKHEVVEAATHRSVIILGWNQDDVTRKHVARYLVGLRAIAIDSALRIRAHLEDTYEDRLEILGNVETIVGTDNTVLSPNQKIQERNPWIAEGIWHLCLVIASHRAEFHPVGKIVALDYAHVAAKDHGLDVAAIYEAGTYFGLSLVECKAYKADPNGAINAAVQFFKDVDSNQHALRIRQSVQNMRDAIPQDLQERISDSFWKRERSYLPNPHYENDSDDKMDWSNNRPSLTTLIPDREHLLIMPHIIQGFDNFFDLVSDEMRGFARSLQNV